jgi:cytochrome c553
MTKGVSTFIGLMVLFCFSALAQAQDAKAKKEYIGDPQQGAVKSALCQGCHGGDGNSATATFPRLANQYAGYIVKQVTNFQSGARHNEDIMTSMAATVTSVNDLKDIAAYFASQPMAKDPLTKPNAKLIPIGDKIFHEGIPERGVYGCVNCHGELGKGKAPYISVFPRIGGQHRDYLIKELTNFRAGDRANDPAGMMQNIARRLSDDEIKAVAEYLSSLLPGNLKP